MSKGRGSLRRGCLGMGESGRGSPAHHSPDGCLISSAQRHYAWFRKLELEIAFVPGFAPTGKTVKIIFFAV